MTVATAEDSTRLTAGMALIQVTPTAGRLSEQRINS